MSLLLPVFFAILVNLSAIYVLEKAVIYVDNKSDQTTIEELLSAEKLQIQKNMLTLLGVNKRPNIIRNPLKKSAPKYLLGIYQSLRAEEGDNTRAKRSVDIDLTKEEQNKAEESDTIMTFEVRKITSLGRKMGRVLWFKVTESNFENSLLEELKIYKRGANLIEQYRIEAFEIMSVKGKQELKLLSYVNVTGGHEGWLSLNLTSYFSNWIANTSFDGRIYITSHSDGNSMHETSLEELGVSCKLKDETTPFVVAFLKADNVIDFKSMEEMKWRVKKSAMRNWYDTDVDTSRRCGIHTLYVSFRDLQWQDWVIAPEGYEAHYCSGECNFPLTEKMNATNHALMQSLMHIRHPSKYHRPCCAPTSLVPVSVLYFLNDFSIILKKYKHMAVKGCGCQ